MDHNGHTKSTPSGESDGATGRARFESDPTQAWRHNGPEAVTRLKLQLLEFQEYAAHYLAVKIDKVMLQVRKIASLAILGVLGAVVGLTAIGVSTIMVLMGTAQGLGELFGGRIWLGYLLTGLVIIIGAAVAVKVLIGGMMTSLRNQLAQAYALRKESQRDRFGRDVQQTAGGVPRAETQSPKSAD